MGRATDGLQQLKRRIAAAADRGRPPTSRTTDAPPSKLPRSQLRHRTDQKTHRWTEEDFHGVYLNRAAESTYCIKNYYINRPFYLFMAPLPPLGHT